MRLIRISRENNYGFTLVEMVVVLAVISILVAIIVPTVVKHIRDARIARVRNEVQVIGSAILSMHKDTGRWPFTNADGPSGGVNRVIGSIDPTAMCTTVAPGALAGAANWGTLGPIKPLYDYIYYNNPDDDTGPINQNQPGQDYPTIGDFRWLGPYLDQPIYADPWGYSYVISARYFPGNPLAVTTAHRVLILSPGPDLSWSTAFSDTITRNTFPDDSPYGDDVGFVIVTNE